MMDQTKLIFIQDIYGMQIVIFVNWIHLNKRKRNCLIKILIEK